MHEQSRIEGDGSVAGGYGGPNTGSAAGISAGPTGSNGATRPRDDMTGAANGVNGQFDEEPKKRGFFASLCNCG
jgi:hypothetical protein